MSRPSPISWPGRSAEKLARLFRREECAARRSVAEKATKPATAAKPNGKAQATKPSGKFSGKKLVPSPAVAKSNPRREGTWGFKSLEIVRQSPGITYEQFLKAGGRHRDLNWDAERRRVVAKA